MTSGTSGGRSLLPLLLCRLLCAHGCQGLKLWLQQSGKHSKLVFLLSGTAGKGRRWLLVGLQWDLVPAPLGFPGSSQPSMPAVHDLSTFRSSSCCLRVIHRPQPLMDSIQLLLPRSSPPSVIHVVAGSRFLLAARVPDILYLRIIFFPGSQFFPSLTSPFLLSAPSMLRWGRGSNSITHHSLPTGCWIHPLLREWEGDAQRCKYCPFSAVFTAARSKVHVAVDAVYR